MAPTKSKHRVLVVSSSDKIVDYVNDMLPADEFELTTPAYSAGEAKRMLVSTDADIVIINAPLSDDFGIELAIELSEGTMGVLLVVKNEVYDQTAYKVEDSGVLTLGKPCSRQSFYTTVKLLCALSARLVRMEQKNRSLQEKMTDIRMVNRAKWLLIENMKMTEKDAHYYIEKQAMDTRLTRREVAESIVRTYDN
ncbi:MAG: ANTAR domain-containing protein [Clostridiales bacterium]|nr:ANTAR domain-containing protein [Clostridiales bacterium]